MIFNLFGNTSTRTLKPPSPPTITLPKISFPDIFAPIAKTSQQIRSELRREGVPVWHYTGRVQIPTPEKVWKGIQYITGFASKIAERAERGYERAVAQPVLTKVAPRGEAPVEQVGRGVVGGLVRAPIAITGIPMLRMGFKGVAAPSALRKELTGMMEYARKRPFEVGAEAATSLLAPYAYGKLPVRPKITTAEFPRGRIGALGIEIKRLHGEASFKPLVSAGRPTITKPISLGKPKIRAEILSEEAYVPQTPFERGIALEYMRRKAPAEMGRMEWGISSQQIIKGVKVKPRELGGVIRAVVEKEHKLPKGTAEVVVKELKRAKARLYGSVMQEAAGREIGVKALSRTPRDIDVQVRDPLKFARKMVEAINKRAGRQVVTMEGESIVVRRTGEKLFDIHPIGFGETSVKGGILLREGGFLAYGFKTGKLIKTKEGIRTTTLSEQALRKLSGAVELRAKPVELGKVRGYIAPTHAGRVKDIYDYFFAGKATVERLRVLGKYGRARELEFRLERWIESWGGDIAKEARRMWRQAQRQTRIELGAFEGRVGVRELIKPSFAVGEKSIAVSPSLSILKSFPISSLYTISPATKSALSSFSTTLKKSGLTSRSMSKGVSKSVVSAMISSTPSSSISRISSSMKMTTSPPPTSSILTPSTTFPQTPRGVSKNEFLRFVGGVSKMRGVGGRSTSIAFLPLPSEAGYLMRRKRRKEEFKIKRVFEEGVADKFLRITPIATPKQLWKGVLRR